MPDVDIDVFDRDGVLKLFKHAPASIIKDNEITKHKTGVYFHAVPTDPINRYASLDYKKEEEVGYFKIDCLNVNIYKNIKSEQELVELMIEEPNWEMLNDPKIVEQLFHLNGHFNIVSKLSACIKVLGKPSNTNPFIQSSNKILSSTTPVIKSSETKSP